MVFAVCSNMPVISDHACYNILTHCLSVLMPEVTLTRVSINFCQWHFKCLHRQSYQGKCEQIVGMARAAPRSAVLVELCWSCIPSSHRVFPYT